jgi:hypothetical protein
MKIKILLSYFTLYLSLTINLQAGGPVQDLESGLGLTAPFQAPSARHSVAEPFASFDAINASFYQTTPRAAVEPEVTPTASSSLKESDQKPIRFCEQNFNVAI